MFDETAHSDSTSMLPLYNIDDHAAELLEAYHSLLA